MERSSYTSALIFLPRTTTKKRRLYTWGRETLFPPLLSTFTQTLFPLNPSPPNLPFNPASDYLKLFFLFFSFRCWRGRKGSKKRKAFLYICARLRWRWSYEVMPGHHQSGEKIAFNCDYRGGLSLARSIASYRRLLFPLRHHGVFFSPLFLLFLILLSEELKETEIISYVPATFDSNIIFFDRWSHF